MKKQVYMLSITLLLSGVRLLCMDGKKGDGIRRAPSSPRVAAVIQRSRSISRDVLQEERELDNKFYLNAQIQSAKQTMEAASGNN